ncbi:MAG: amidohydrolase family protein [Acidimicrobiales bacterium]
MATMPVAGIIDGDGHVLEPATLWLDYLEAPLRERAIRVVPNDAGLEVLEIDGAPFTRLSAGSLALLGAMGDETARPGPERRYMETMPFGAGDAGERVQWLDQQGIERVVLYPTIGIIWESTVSDARLADAYARAYNRWIADFCRDSGGRLIPIAHISLSDADLAATELARAVADGCKGAMVFPYTWTRLPHGHSYYDPLWRVAADLEVPVGIHPSYEPDFCNTLYRFRDHSSTPGVGGPEGGFMGNVSVRQGVMTAFSSYFAYSTFERFPKLRVGVLESGAGWIGSFLDRMDVLAGETLYRHSTRMTRPPSEYFRTNCFISCDPDETAAPLIIDHVGADRFIWATDFPHPDHPADWRGPLEKFLGPLSPDTASRVLGRNVADLYGLPAQTAARARL